MENSSQVAVGQKSSEERSVEVFDIVDPTAMAEGFEALDQEVVQLGSGRFHARRIVVKLVNCSVVVHIANTRARTRTKIHPQMVAFAALGPRARGTLNGVELAPNNLMVAAPGEVGELVVEAGYRSASILIPPDRVVDQFRRRGRGDTLHMPQGVARWQSEKVEVRQLYDFCWRLTDRARRRPELFDHHVAARQAADDEVLELLVETLGHGEKIEPKGGEKTRENYSRIVHLAEQRAEAASFERLYVADLCEAAMVSERTLETAFRKTVGMTPVGFLRRQRFHGARRALREARRGTTTVSSVALDWGFWHFGEFSKGYKECFGESPSETLRRRWTS